MNRGNATKSVSLDDLMVQVQNVVDALNQVMKLAKDSGLELEVFFEGNEKNPIFPTKEQYVASISMRIE